MITFWHGNATTLALKILKRRKLSFSLGIVIFSRKTPSLSKFQDGNIKILKYSVFNCNFVVNRLFFGEIKPKITILFAF